MLSWVLYHLTAIFPSPVYRLLTSLDPLLSLGVRLQLYYIAKVGLKMESNSGSAALPEVQSRRITSTPATLLAHPIVDHFPKDQGMYNEGVDSI